jgi:phytoene dehydrogenase-like protein
MTTTAPIKTPPTSARSTKPPRSTKGDRTYDAIVIGGGHNGLVNGAYLAKSGLKTLILERRHLVGGAAITEELRPGFWFTTFSYALSLLRPDIIHELELTKHGFMPLLMSSTFAPMENGDTVVHPGPQREPQGDRALQARRGRLRAVPHDVEMTAGHQAAARHGAAQQRPGGAHRVASIGCASASSTSASSQRRPPADRQRGRLS